jgi:hypothetical protein
MHHAMIALLKQRCHAAVACVQAQALGDAGHVPDKVIMLEGPHALLLDRVKYRRIDYSTGWLYRHARQGWQAAFVEWLAGWLGILCLELGYLPHHRITESSLTEQKSCVMPSTLLQARCITWLRQVHSRRLCAL